MPSERTLQLLATLPEQVRADCARIDTEWEAATGGGLSKYAPRYFDREGERLTMGEWTLLFGLGMEYRQVAFDDLGQYHVSTIWLGLDHNMGLLHPEDGPPYAIFESMVFANDLSVHRASEAFMLGDHEFPAMPEFTYHEDFEMRRYATEAQALRGHAELVDEIRLTTAALASMDPRDLVVRPDAEDGRTHE